MPCSGYRDTQLLRIQNESQSVARRALRIATPFEPRSLPLSVDMHARYAFFAHYVTSPSKCWDFLERYYHPTDSPVHLTLAIDAVSLAYLWHKVYSDAALATARKRYISALRVINGALRSPEEAVKSTTLLASLLLDLFEKITDSESRNNKSWISHVIGALALVRFRGIERFQEPYEFRVLVRLNNHYLGSCVTSCSLVPDELAAVRAYVEKYLNAQDHTLRLSDLIIRYAKLRSESRSGVLSHDEYIRVSMELDLKIQALDHDMPLSWQYSSIILDQKSERAFDLRFDSYPSRNICQAWNFLRVVRILLNVSLIEHNLASPSGGKDLASIRVARGNIEILARDICACVPQYVDCEIAARRRLPFSKESEILDKTPDCILNRGPAEDSHPHTPRHQADCYTLIFPLYAAGRSGVAPGIRPWVIKQLRYISSHFYIRNAEVVAQILERDTNICPWEVYAMLGSYAFTA